MKYFDAEQYIKNDYPFIIIIGGRGIGKTYSTLRYITANNLFHIYLRNSDKVLQICSSEMGNPYKAINTDFGTGYQFHMTKDGTAMILDHANDDRLIGYGAALSTFSNLRGVSMPEVEIVIFDEFLEITHGKNKQSSWFFNFYETVARNRELQGKKPLKVIMLANSMNIDNSILADFGVINIIEEMVRNGQQKCSIPEKGIMILLPEMSEFSIAKADTALYRATADSAYYSMAVNNRFTENDFSNIRKTVNLYEYSPLCSYNGIYIYSHKAHNKLYVCRKYANCPTFSEHGKLGFKRQFGAYIRSAMIDGAVEYSDYNAKYVLTSLLL